MMDLSVLEELKAASSTKIVLLILDGLGGLPMKPNGPTELEAANSPNLDRLASEGVVGLSIPIRHGITPGSGPAHLALFGYEPLQYIVGRGVLEATGVGMKVNEGDVAARGNLCTIDSAGVITDRRAGRIPTDQALPVIELLDDIEIEGVQVEVKHVKEYRFVVVLRGNHLSPNLEDTDPQQTGLRPLKVVANDPASNATAELFSQWIDTSTEVLSNQDRANALTLRGFSTDPKLPQFENIYGLKAACVAVYPMYKGVSNLVGMEVISFDGDRPSDVIQAVADVWDKYDFFFIHIKNIDSKGEDGDFDGKAAAIEAVDQVIPELLHLEPDVLAVTGDHSTPARLRKHSWHPVPLLLWAPATARPDNQNVFGESSCLSGGLGTISATSIMPLLLAHAGRLEKFGA
jgi:2,3-bisphosphoglycerate-independent phosphoglycerate mutase